MLNSGVYEMLLKKHFFFVAVCVQNVDTTQRNGFVFVFLFRCVCAELDANDVLVREMILLFAVCAEFWCGLCGTE